MLAGRQVQLCRTAEESRAVNQIGGPALIISSSGMMTGGRILHHLKQRLPSNRNTIVLGGFQASGTRGRSLANGAKFLRIHGQDVPVRAAVESVPGLSGHADRGELLRWISCLATPKQVMLVHGEPASADALAASLRKDRGWKVQTPDMGETVELR